MEAETLGATLGYVRPESPLDTPADTCRGVGQDCWGDTEQVKAKALVDRQADTIRQLTAKKSSDTLRDEEAKTLVDMQAERQAEVEAETVGYTLGNVDAEHCSILLLKGWHK